ncbi:MAG: hypothetical protein WD604_15485 [Balneolaceae bacterium]
MESDIIENEVRCLVFSTSFKNNEEVEEVAEILDSIPGITDWSVDLDDWENVLRIECTGTTPEKVIGTLSKVGVTLEEMPL